MIINESGRPWGLYIHVPWCRRRCPYCDFYFEVGRPRQGFVDALLQEWAARKLEMPWGKSRLPAKSLYFGGGTPSLLGPKEIAGLVDAFKNEGVLAPGAEITIEANPEDLAGELWLGAGEELPCTRISLGIQSFSDSTLRWLGRKHSAEQARAVVERLAVMPGLKLSVDLIVGVPKEDRDAIALDIAWLARLGVGHVSAYLLTVEEGTPLQKLIARGARQSPCDDAQAEAYVWLQSTLTAAGFKQYEVSSYAVPGQEAVHNRLYWSKGDYLGLGPGAHSMRLMPDGSVERRNNLGNLQLWFQNPAAAPNTKETLTAKEAFLEALAFGVRDMQAGVDPAALARRHGIALPTDLNAAIISLENKGFLWGAKTDSGQPVGSIYLTSSGALFADAVSREFLGL
jgi:oxygen-independent coproporphyrinogen-3 oxidase